MLSLSLVKLGLRTPEKRSVKVSHSLKLHDKNVLNWQIENVTIANALQLEATRRHASLLRFN